MKIIKRDIFLLINVVTSACFFMFCALSLYPFQVDDAFITYRFVEQYINSGLIAYNPGGEVVEGFSSPLWFMLLSAVKQLMPDWHLPFISIVISLGAALVILYLSHFCVQNRKASLFYISYACSCAPLAFYSVTGLESAFYALLITCCL